MKKSFLPSFTTLWLVCACTALLADAPVSAFHPAAFVHPGLRQNLQDLEFMKSQILAGREPWKSAFDRLRVGVPGAKHPAGNILDFQPHAFAHVVRGSYGRPAIGGAELSASADTAYRAALIWYVTGDRAYAGKAIEIIHAWSSTLWDFDDNDAKLLAGWTGGLWCNAAEILRYTDAGWKKEGIAEFERMLRTVYQPLLRYYFPEANGNWDAAIMDSLLSMSVFLDDHALFDHTVEHFLRGPGNSGITKYVYPSGQCQETTRDSGHTQLGLGYLIQTAQVAWTQGVDLFGAADNRLALGLEYSARYDGGETVPIKGLPSSPGPYTDIYQAAYRHYSKVKGLELPFVAKAAAATESTSALNLLTACRTTEANDPTPSKGPLLPSTTAAVAGAGGAAPSAPPAASVTVTPGESIQAALDASAGTGRWVVLQKGVHLLSTTLRIPSGTTLAGTGGETIVFLDPKAANIVAGRALTNATSDMHDVVIRDLVVEGAVITTRATTNDPNQDRRGRSHQGAIPREGIAFLGDKVGALRHIRLEHVTVRNCTRSGAIVAGASDVEIAGCDFSDNGSSVVPGNRLHHNLLLSHVTAAKVHDSQFDTSPWGCGIEARDCRDLAILQNEMARNSFHGIHVADGEDVRIEGNRVEGNDGRGIFLENFPGPASMLEVAQNLVHYNGSRGIVLPMSKDAVARNNTELENGSRMAVRYQDEE